MSKYANPTTDYTDYYEAVRFLESLSSFSDIRVYAKDTLMDKFLERTKYFLKLVGSPEKDLKVIHIAGTSGKGSVASLIQQQITKSGRKTGLFVSPFATTSIEKISVDNLYIDPHIFAQIVDDLKPYINKAYLEGPYGAPSYFELFLAIALIYYKRMNCEWAVIEAGLGGKYDATNALENKVVTILTNADYDHTDLLGKTLTKITRDKLGIIRKNTPFITGETRPHLLDIMRTACGAVGVNKFIAVGKTDSYSHRNQAIASEAIKQAGLGGFDTSLEVVLPCRFEQIQQNPLVIIDGAHNNAKIHYSLSRVTECKYEKLTVVFAIAKDKDYQKILRSLLDVADRIILTKFTITHREAASPKKLLAEALLYKPKANISVNLDPFAATNEALAESTPNDLVLVTGSFFLAGDIRKLWYPEEYILKNRSYK